MWKELGEALGDLAGTGERVNMVSAASSGDRTLEAQKVLEWVCHPGPTSVERAAEGCGAAIEYQEARIECWTDG